MRDTIFTMKRPTDTTTLTTDQFNQALQELGWRQVDFARKTGVTSGAVNRWATGKDVAPLWATAYLGMAQDLAQLHAKYLSPVKAPKPTPTPDDDEVANHHPTGTTDLVELVARVNAAPQPPTD